MTFLTCVVVAAFVPDIFMPEASQINYRAAPLKNWSIHTISKSAKTIGWTQYYRVQSIQLDSYLYSMYSQT